MSTPVQNARHLKSLLWGRPEGPHHYSDLPESLRNVADFVDQIGDDLAAARIRVFREDVDPDDPIPQVQLLAHVLARQVLPADLDDLPDREVVWTRSDLEGESFDSEALDAAFHFLAHGGEPNVWRAEPVVGRPSLKDVAAIQQFARDLTDAAVGFELAGITPTQLVEDFVRMHWSNDRQTGGLTNFWEDSPVGHALFRAVRRVTDIPAEEAEIVHAPTPGDDWKRGR